MSCTIVGALVVSFLWTRQRGPRLPRLPGFSSPISSSTWSPGPADGADGRHFRGKPDGWTLGAFPDFPPARRLDGSLLSVPPWHVTTCLGHPFHLNRPHAPVVRADKQTTMHGATGHRPTHVQVHHPVVPPSVGPERAQALRGARPVLAAPGGTCRFVQTAARSPSSETVAGIEAARNSRGRMEAPEPRRTRP